MTARSLRLPASMPPRKKHNKGKRTTVSYRRVRTPNIDIVADPVASAKLAGLRYVTDEQPGIRRNRRATASPTSTPTASASATRTRWAASASSRFRRPGPTSGSAPPRTAISRPRAGTPAGRKQYRYHPRWREVRDETKYSRMIAFGRALPEIRERSKRTWRCPACRARRCWPRSCACWRRP